MRTAYPSVVRPWCARLSASSTASIRASTWSVGMCTSLLAGAGITVAARSRFLASRILPAPGAPTEVADRPSERLADLRADLRVGEEIVEERILAGWSE